MEVSSKDPFSAENSSKQRIEFSFSVLIRKIPKQPANMSEKFYKHKKFSKWMPREQYQVIYEINLKLILIVVFYMLT